MRAIRGKFRHPLVIADIDKRKIRKVVRKTCAQRRKVTLLKDVKMRKRFEEKVAKLVDVGAPILWGHLWDGVFEACDEVCWRKGGGGEIRELHGGGMKR